LKDLELSSMLNRGYLRGSMVLYGVDSTRTIYRLIEEGELPRVKIRGCLRIPIWEIEKYEERLNELGKF